jgi:Subtilase family
VIDTGFRSDDYELQGYCWDPYVSYSVCPSYKTQYSYDFVANTYSLPNSSDPAPNGNTWHGLKVAETAAAALNNHLGGAGTAPGADVYLFRLSSSYTDYEAARAVNTAVAWGADVINMSFGGWRYGGVGANGFASALQNAVNNGVINVASAGNDGVYSNRNTSFNNIVVPAGWAPVIGVGAIDSAGLRSDWGASSSGAVQASNFGPIATVWAGGSVISHTPSPSNSCWSQSQCLYYNYREPFSGTSAAAPVVSGIVAVMKQVKPNLTQGEVQNIFQSTGHIVNGMLVVDESAAVKEALIRNGGVW